MHTVSFWRGPFEVNRMVFFMTLNKFLSADLARELSYAQSGSFEVTEAYVVAQMLEDIGLIVEVSR
jgi:uncharacterized membrane protein